MGNRNSDQGETGKARAVSRRGLMTAATETMLVGALAGAGIAHADPAGKTGPKRASRTDASNLEGSSGAAKRSP